VYKTASITLLTKVSSAVITFVVMVLLSRWLGPEQRGICSFYLVIITAILIISDFAGGSATAFLLNRYPPGSIFKSHIVWSVLPACLIPLWFWVRGGIDGIECLGLLLAGWLHSAWTILQHLWLGLKEYKKFNAFIFLSPLLILLVFAACWAWGFTHRYAYLLALNVAWAICFGLGLKYFLPQYSLGNKLLKLNDLLRVFKAGSTNQLSHLVALAHTRLIYFLLPPTALGVYSNALTITEASFMLAGSLGQIMYSTVTSDIGNTNNKLIFSNLWWIIVAIISCVVGVILVLPEAWLLWLFGAGFQGVKRYLLYLSGGMLFNSLFLIISYWQSAYGRFALNLRNLLAGFVCNLLYTIVVFAKGSYSIEAGAVGLVLGWLVAALAATITLYRQQPDCFAYPSGMARVWAYLKKRQEQGRNEGV
jgi:O-antigen/teichoic acid export membrane protein